jgi:hypothetical protein
MARVFAYFMEKKVQMTDEAIFHDTLKLLKKAIESICFKQLKLILALPLLKSL